jgi:hypothetical protein
MINYNDNSILIDLNSSKRNKNSKSIFCVLCNNEKIQLECFNPSENRFRCPRCKNSYQLGQEILPQDDILESSHDSEEGAILISAEDEFKSEDNDTSKSDIRVPKYMQSNGIQKVIHFREE